MRTKKKRRGRWSTVLQIHIGKSAISRTLRKYTKNKWHDSFLFVCITKNEKTSGAFDGIFHVLHDRKSVRKALRISGYYIYWPKYMQEWFPLLPDEKQQTYYGWAERMLESTLKAKMNNYRKSET